MSGGRFNYSNDTLCYDIFGISADYGPDGFENYKYARKTDPFFDKQISELVWDVFVLIHSVDWYASGDTGEEDYRKDVRFFKEKWFGKTPEEFAKREIEKTLAEAKEELYQSFGIATRKEEQNE